MAKVELDVAEMVEETFEKHFGVTLDRLRELAEADRDGLVRILPYSVLAYKIYAKRNRHGNTHRRIVECVNYGFPESEIGKTVFLTREAAEAALKAGDHR